MKRCVKQKENPLQNYDVWTAATAACNDAANHAMSLGPVENGGAKRGGRLPLIFPETVG